MGEQASASEEPLHRRLVLKCGTNLLTAGTERLDRAVMASIADQVAEVRARGCEVIVVTSGAIAAGRDGLGARAARLQRLTRRQVLAAVGQARLFAYWDELFAERGITAAQALLARADLVDRQRYLNARNTLLALLELDVVPVVNENDVVSIEEIQDSVIGDNDNLSAQVANLVDADLLVILTDTAGLYTADPASDPEARLIERVERIDAAIEAAARGQPGRRGTGGMVTKLEAARLATQSGAHVVIAEGRGGARGVGARPRARRSARTSCRPPTASRAGGASCCRRCASAGGSRSTTGRCARSCAGARRCCRPGWWGPRAASSAGTWCASSRARARTWRAGRRTTRRRTSSGSGGCTRTASMMCWATTTGTRWCTATTSCWCSPPAHGGAVSAGAAPR